MPFEDELGAALRRTADTFDTDTQSLVTAGAARGRVLRRRRTTAIVAGAAGLALVGVGGFVLAGLGTGEVGKSSRVASPAAPVSSSATKTIITGDEVVALLKKQLPKGTFSQESGSVLGADGAVANLVYDDGKGASAIALGLSRASTDPPTCPDPAYAAEGATCSVTQLAGGGQLYLNLGYEYSDRRVDTKDWNAILTAADGRRIDLQEWNSSAEKGAAITRTDPPLSAKQLRAIVSSRVWDKVFKALPESRTTATPKAPDTVSVKTIIAAFQSMLPYGMSGTIPAETDDFPDLTVDDGKGASLVEINYENWGKDGYTDAIFADATVLTDGTKVIVRQGAAEKGASGTVQWIVDTVRPNGLRVAVSELNAPGYHDAPSRSKPAISISDLQAIATNAKWAKLG
ncbi:hypothetical protein OG607_19860 [Streptomyces sp. NBC_01537]|uniref:hypothetical protein n=1 Tax=Streptomyces sp. NBC_01537 TaxID=2903896 RepID=UPI00386D3B18